MREGETLTNQQISAKPTWVIASTFLECNHCGFLSRALSQDLSARSCSNCGARGEPRTLFPAVHCIKVLEMIAYFYHRASARGEERDRKLAKSLGEIIGRRCEPVYAVGAAQQAQKLLRGSDRSQAAYSNFVKLISRHLRIRSQKLAKKSFVELLNYRPVTEEHQIVVVLTAMLLEVMFDEFLKRLLSLSKPIGELVPKKSRRVSLRECRRRYSGNLEKLALCEVR